MIADVVVVRLDPIPGECFACGRHCDLSLGVPVYEDQVLPNDWQGEWGGYAACRDLFEWQQTITEPTLARLSPCVDGTISPENQRRNLATIEGRSE